MPIPGKGGVRATVLFGFLGAGKTTLLSHWLDAEAPGALIVNEFGALGIDGPRLARARVEVVELSGGCICCELKGPLGDTVDALAEEGVETLWIEASGVARPHDILGDLARRCTLEAAATVVDAARFRTMVDRLGPFYADQVRGAGTVVVNKIDLAPAAELEAVRAGVADLNPGATVVFAEGGRVERTLVAPPPAADDVVGHTHAAAESCIVDAPALSRAAAERFFARLPDEVWRAKGYAEIDGAPCFVNWAPGSLEIAHTPAPPHRHLVFIGRRLDRDALSRALAGAG